MSRGYKVFEENVTYISKAFSVEIYIVKVNHPSQLQSDQFWSRNFNLAKNRNEKLLHPYLYSCIPFKKIGATHKLGLQRTKETGSRAIKGV